MITKYDKVLVAVDGSKNAELALKHAVEIAGQNGAALYILAVIDEDAISHSSFAFSKVLEEEKERVENEMTKYLAYAAENDSYDTVPLIVTGNPKDYIATIVPNEEKIDLIVIGATGKGRLTETTVGSTTNYVVQNAPCTVFVIKE